jgi:replicative DNA helicase
MSPNESGDSDWLSLGIIAAELHELARVYEIPIVTGSQVNRPKDPSRQEYSTRRVARSDMLTNSANVIVQIACRENEDTRTDMPIYITKMRDGEKGYFVLSKNFAKMKVVDIMDEDFEDDDDSGI